LSDCLLVGLLGLSLLGATCGRPAKSGEFPLSVDNSGFPDTVSFRKGNHCLIGTSSDDERILGSGCKLRAIAVFNMHNIEGSRMPLDIDENSDTAGVRSSGDSDERAGLQLGPFQNFIRFDVHQD